MTGKRWREGKPRGGDGSVFKVSATVTCAFQKAGYDQVEWGPSEALRLGTVNKGMRNLEG